MRIMDYWGTFGIAFAVIGVSVLIGTKYIDPQKLNIAYLAAKAKTTKPQGKTLDDAEWKAESIKCGFEGAAAIVLNNAYAIFWLISVNSRTGEVQAEIPGGKIHTVDGGDAEVTALRKFFDETGIALKREDLDSVLITTGQTNTGEPNKQFITKPMEEIVPMSRSTKFEGYVYSHIYYASENDAWMVLWRGKYIFIRRYNTFFLKMHMEALKRSIIPCYYEIEGVDKQIVTLKNPAVPQEAAVKL